MKTPSDLLIRPNQRIRRKTYFEHLESDDWKAFARSFRARHSNACAVCRRCDVETQVHHIAYDFQRKPWEYSDEELVLLCGPCHKASHAELNKFRRFVFGKLTPQSFRVLNGALAVGLDHNDPLELAYAISEMCASPRSVKLFADAASTTKKATGGQQ